MLQRGQRGSDLTGVLEKTEGCRHTRMDTRPRKETPAPKAAGPVSPWGWRLPGVAVAMDTHFGHTRCLAGCAVTVSPQTGVRGQTCVSG